MKSLIAAIVSLIACTVSAHAQGFPGTYLGLPNNNFNSVCCLGPTLGPPNPATDYVSMGQLNPGPGGSGMIHGFFLPLSSFASSTQLAAVNNRVNQAFDQINQANRGIAASTAMANTWMPSAPGRTTWAVNAAAFQSEVGGGISVAHRLNFSMPVAVTAAYGNGGGSAHVGRVGLMGEF